MLLNSFDHGHHFIYPFSTEKRSLARNQDRIAGDERARRDEFGRWGSVKENVVVGVLNVFKGILEDIFFRRVVGEFLLKTTGRQSRSDVIDLHVVDSNSSGRYIVECNDVSFNKNIRKSSFVGGDVPAEDFCGVRLMVKIDEEHPLLLEGEPIGEFKSSLTFPGAALVVSYHDYSLCHNEYS